MGMVIKQPPSTPVTAPLPAPRSPAESPAGGTGATREPSAAAESPEVFNTSSGAPSGGD